MPRIINTEGIPEGQALAFMQAIVDYERTIGAELDEGHIALARFIFCARIDQITPREIKEWVTFLLNDSNKPIDMVLYCPNPACGAQHIDAPTPGKLGNNFQAVPPWHNPPHRSHLCGSCGYVWRPADVPTNGVQSITTRGKNDTLTHGGGATAINMQYVNPPPLDGPLRVIASGGGGGPTTTALYKDALEALSTLCEIASNSATTTAAVYEVDRLRLVVQRTIGVPQVDANNVTIEDYKEALADKALLTHELDVLLNGAGAAKQAALCDIVAQVRNEGIRSKNYRES